MEITISDNVLQIRGERQEEKAEGRRSEFRYGTFSRSIMLPRHADPDKIQATFENGVLTVRVPMAKTEDSKRISIQKIGS
ncbi:Hsp20/alpha crystallin family protein [Actinocorallia aurea]